MPQDDWESLRREMPVAGNWAYFDHAAVAPLPRPAYDVMCAWARDQLEGGAVNWSTWSRRLDQTRAAGAQLLGAAPEEIALLRNTTEGVNLVAEGFPWRSGDNVVLPSCEFPSNRFPWLNLKSRGVEARVVACRDGKIEPAAISEACDARTRIVACSWVHYATGWRSDVGALAEVAHRAGALFFLDAIQALGVLPLDVRQAGVDFLAADGHKWLIGPEGAALFYLRREHLDRLRPIGVGWNSVEAAADFSSQEMHLKPTAARYEGGTYPVAGLVGLGASLELLLQHSQAARAERLLQLTDELCERLIEIGATIFSDRQGDHRSGIVAFDVPGEDPRQVVKRCRTHHVVINSRDGRLRASPHLYNNQEDLDRLVGALTTKKT